jgi:hypothetical protein
MSASTFFLLTCFSLTSGPQFVADYPIHNAEACANVLRLYTSTHHDEHRTCGCVQAEQVQDGEALGAGAVPY